MATFMLLVDIMIVQVALPSIGRQFHAGLTGLQWTIDAYALSLSALIVASGTIADRFGRRRVFLSGLVVFTLASVACGAAPNLGTLEAARAVQGIGGAAMFATSLALVAQEFPGAARGPAIAIWGAVVGVAVASGPLLGGLLIQAADWRWVFLVNAPIGVLDVVLTRRFVGEGADPNPRRLDLPGVVTFSAGLSLLCAGLLRGAESNWAGASGPVFAVAGAVLLAGFVALQWREHALFGVHLFRSRAFSGVSLGTLAIGAGMFAMILYITIFLQNVLGNTALGGGLRMLPMTAGVFVVPLVMRRAGVSVISGRVLASGLLLGAAGLALMVWAASDTSWTRLIPGEIVGGIGIGIANPSIAGLGLAVVPPNRSGLAAGISNTCRIAGIAVGVAALGAVFHHRIDTAVASGAQHARAVSLVAAGQLHPAAAVSGHGLASAQHAFTVGLHWVLVTGALIVLAGGLVALRWVRIGAPSGAQQPAQVPQPSTAA
jgi:EmrB/QacA subfamily drug resistance transporter